MKAIKYFFVIAVASILFSCNNSLKKESEIDLDSDIHTFFEDIVDKNFTRDELLKLLPNDNKAVTINKEMAVYEIRRDDVYIYAMFYFYGNEFCQEVDISFEVKNDDELKASRYYIILSKSLENKLGKPFDAYADDVTENISWEVEMMDAVNLITLSKNQYQMLHYNSSYLLFEDIVPDADSFFDYYEDEENGEWVQVGEDGEWVFVTNN